ncbi:hypothetical protein OX283_007305 [Flavobacterium sp. SUN052]|uniref:hypothetical protein n=1 Tax=Flavobacterium sp. SUN052 TaxID=3002441 RepID=UPI00237E776D|nr:hypothetical protein [Flavobacterium sp. SUN052]MEC4004458.1 hypothetical protein [Flavobacterium sp. SUN052]
MSKLILFWCLFLFLMFCETTIAQNYRNAKAYINDFGKNELFMKESLMEYSTSIIDASPDARVQNTLERIYTKLEDINVNLLKNDIGVSGDFDLRDSFIKLNNKTITLLKNKSLKLNDYRVQSGLDYSEIFKNFAYKESEIAKYYSEILAYETAKRDFGIKYKIVIRSFNKRNVFEYDAYQNLIFYKLNVLDDKLIQLFKYRNSDDIQECINFMTSVAEESLIKTDIYKDDFVDKSLNDINIEFINFMLTQNETLLPLYQQYVSVYEDFQKIKTKFLETNEVIKVEDYNNEVRRYNDVKNRFFDSLYENQIKKAELLKRWYTTNSDFLKRNIEFEDLYEKFTNLD